MESEEAYMSDGNGAPRWVKVSGIVVIVLVLVFVILHLTGHGFGGHHMPFGALAP